jgi:HSP20 family protein
MARSNLSNQERSGEMTPQESRPYTPPYGTNYPPSPFGIMRRLSDEMDRMFGDFMGPFGNFGQSQQRFGSNAMQANQWANQWTPPLEVFERNNRFVVRAELPGMNRKDVRVEIEDDMLTISGERREEYEENRQGFRHNERRFGRFFRRIPLPEGTEPDEVQASFKNGLLEVEVPLHQPEHRSRQVDIKDEPLTH